MRARDVEKRRINVTPTSTNARKLRGRRYNVISTLCASWYRIKDILIILETDFIRCTENVLLIKERKWNDPKYWQCGNEQTFFAVISTLKQRLK